MWWWLACGNDPVETDVPDTDDTGDAPRVPFDPDLDGYPRLLASPADKDTIRARLAGTAEDPLVRRRWTELADHLRSSCARTPPVVASDPIDLGAMHSAAAIARNCAFLSWLEDDADAAAKAAAILAAQPINAADLDDPESDVHLWTALGLEAETVDLLLGTSFVDADAVSAPVLALARTSYQRFVLDEALYFKIGLSNHNLKFAGALGLCGLVFDDDPQAPSWLAAAQGQISYLLAEGQLTTPEGGFGEGPYYEMYADFQVIPYLRAWHRDIGTGDHDFQAACTILPNPACPADGWSRIGDLWEHPQIRAMWAWNAAIRMPDGARFPFDDSVPVGHPSAMLAEIDATHGWDWATQDAPVYEWAGDVSAEILASWDGRMAAPTSDACWTSPSTGTAVLATDHGRDASWALLLGESSGPMTPTGHEQPDAATFGFWANGTWFVLDPGYAGWTERDATASYADHAGITVDGDGPPSGRLSDLDVTWTPLDGCAAEVSIPGDAAWTRRLRLEERALVVEDRLSAFESHTYAWRLPVLTGEGRGTLELRDWGAIVRRDGQDLAVVVSGADGLSTEIRPDALDYGTFRDHDVLVATITGADAAFFAVLAPIEAGSEPTVEVDADRIAVNGVAWASALE